MTEDAGNPQGDPVVTGRGSWSDRDVTLLTAKATAAAIAVAAVAFGLWKVRTVVIMLLLALTFAAAIRPGVEWLHRRRVPQPVAILFFLLIVIGVVFFFFWVAIPPALHQVGHALNIAGATGGTVPQGGGFKHDVLVWLQEHLHELPTGSQLLHPVATFGHKATTVVVWTLFTIAATWYWVSERDRMIDLLTLLAPEAKREKARATYLEIDRRLGSYTRLKFLMVFAIGAVLSFGFYLVGLNYWLLLGGFVSLIEIVPVIGPIIGSILVLAVGLPQSVHVGVLSLLVLVVVREFQSYVINPHVMGHSVGLSPLVTLVSVVVVGILFGAFAVILAIPVTSAVATLIDVFVLDHEAPTEPVRQRRSLLSSRSKRSSS
jgi:predicted PurR-regulated permease PerM